MTTTTESTAAEAESTRTTRDNGTTRTPTSRTRPTGIGRALAEALATSPEGLSFVRADITCVMKVACESRGSVQIIVPTLQHDDVVMNMARDMLSPVELEALAVFLATSGVHLIA